MLATIFDRARTINPTAIYPYVDKSQLWLRDPLTPGQLSQLDRLCRGGVHVLNEPRRFDARYRQRLQLRQPTREALEWFSGRDDAELNAAELSLDWIFGNEFECEEAYAFACQHHVKKHHRAQQVTFVGEGGVTRYSGPRGAANVLATYRDKPSKVTGEVHAVHFDWRITGAAAMRRAGLGSIADLLALDPHHFWLGRLLLYGIDLDQLGRVVLNDERRTKRRKPWVISRPSGFTYHMDRRAGSFLYRAAGSTQVLLDKLEPRLRQKVRERALVSMDDGHLLPALGESFL
jgi:hypothetical protein